MPVKKIIVPFYINAISKNILEYASELALASNSRLSCICSITEDSEQKLSDNHKKSYVSTVSCLNTINKILYKKNIPYEVILTKHDIIKNIQEITASGCLFMIVVGMSDFNTIFPSVKQTHITALLLSEDNINQ